MEILGKVSKENKRYIVDKQIHKVEKDVKKGDKKKAQKDIKKLLKMDKKFDREIEECHEKKKKR